MITSHLLNSLSFLLAVSTITIYAMHCGYPLDYETKGIVTNKNNIPIRPFESSIILNNYWKSLQDKSVAEKNSALQKIMDLNCRHWGWEFTRYHLIAATLIGANVNSVSSSYTPLSKACYYADVELVHILLTHGADANLSDHFKQLPLRLASKVSIVKLLLQYGAKITSSIVEVAMSAHYSSKVLDVYFTHNPNLCLKSYDNTNILHWLGMYAHHYENSTTNLLKKTSSIFGHISKKQAWQFLTMRDPNHRIPEECISNIMTNESTHTLKKLFTGKREALEPLFKKKFYEF